MAEDLMFPRVLYRGHPDVRGLGTHVSPVHGELVGEVLRCESADDLDRHTAAGWRLTREIPDVPVDEGAESADDSAADAPARTRTRKK